MKIIKSFACFITICAVIGCEERNGSTANYDTPKKVVLTSVDSKGYDGVPPEMSEIVTSIEFDEADIIEKELGYPPHRKVKFFNVTSYVTYGDGWLVASGKGEWGGIIFWLSKMGEYKLIRDDDLAYPIDIIKEGSSLFLTQGMSHLTLSDGQLLVITREQGKFETVMYPLDGYPGKIKKSDGEWIVQMQSPNGSYYILSEILTGKPHKYTR